MKKYYLKEFDWDLILIVKEKELLKYIKTEDITGTSTTYTKPNQHITIINIPENCLKNNNKEFILKTSIHETTHFITHIMGKIGIEDDEFRAYYIAYRSIEVYNYFLKQKNALNKRHKKTK